MGNIKFPLPRGCPKGGGCLFGLIDCWINGMME